MPRLYIYAKHNHCKWLPLCPQQTSALVSIEEDVSSQFMEVYYTLTHHVPSFQQHIMVDLHTK